MRSATSNGNSRNAHHSPLSYSSDTCRLRARSRPPKVTASLITGLAGCERRPLLLRLRIHSPSTARAPATASSCAGPRKKASTKRYLAPGTSAPHVQRSALDFRARHASGAQQRSVHLRHELQGVGKPGCGRHSRGLVLQLVSAQAAVAPLLARPVAR